MLQLTGKPLEMCPVDCPLMEVEIMTTEFYADSISHYIDNEPHCTHEQICQYAFDLGRKSREGGAE